MSRVRLLNDACSIVVAAAIAVPSAPAAAMSSIFSTLVVAKPRRSRPFDGARWISIVTARRSGWPSAGTGATVNATAGGRWQPARRASAETRVARAPLRLTLGDKGSSCETASSRETCDLTGPVVIDRQSGACQLVNPGRIPGIQPDDLACRYPRKGKSAGVAASPPGLSGCRGLCILPHLPSDHGGPTVVHATATRTVG